MPNERVSINVTWVSLFVSVFTLFAMIASATWWISGIRAEQVLATWERKEKERIESELKDPAVPLAVALYVNQRTIPKEEWQEFKRYFDSRMSGIEQMLKVIGDDYANEHHKPAKKSGE